MGWRVEVLEPDRIEDVLAVLVDALQDQRPPSIERFAPDGDLRPAWNACRLPWALLSIIAAIGGRRELVRLGCSALEPLLSVGDYSRERDALAIIDAWCREEGSEQAAGAVFDEMDAIAQEAFERDDAERVRLAELVRDLSEAVTIREGTAMHVVLGIVRKAVPVEELASFIRAHATCPSLEAVLASGPRLSELAK